MVMYIPSNNPYAGFQSGLFQGFNIGADSYARNEQNKVRKEELEKDRKWTNEQSMIDFNRRLQIEQMRQEYERQQQLEQGNMMGQDINAIMGYNQQMQQYPQQMAGNQMLGQVLGGQGSPTANLQNLGINIGGPNIPAPQMPRMPNLKSQPIQELYAKNMFDHMFINPMDVKYKQAQIDAEKALADQRRKPESKTGKLPGWWDMATEEQRKNYLNKETTPSANDKKRVVYGYVNGKKRPYMLSDNNFDETVSKMMEDGIEFDQDSLTKELSYWQNSLQKTLNPIGEPIEGQEETAKLAAEKVAIIRDLMRQQGFAGSDPLGIR